MEDILEEILQDEIVDETDVFVEMEKLSKVNRRTFDYGRLRLLDMRLVDEKLGETEVNAVSAHLKSNYPQFSAKGSDDISMTEAQIRQLVSNCPVIEIDPSTVKKDMYTRGVVATHCTVILRGKVKVQAGREGFESELGSWSVLAADSLITPDGTYVPDFTASYIGTDAIRCLHIPRVDFQRILYPIHIAPTSDQDNI